jgi:DNA-binding beta-propeller fold protein YncE
MTPFRVTLTVLVLLALGGGATIAAGNGGHESRGGYEVWTVDQSNSAGKASGGTVYIYSGRGLERSGGGAVPQRIDLGGAAEELCVRATGTAPVRPHMLFFNRARTHAVLSYVATGHVLFFDAAKRRPLACIDVGVQAHAAVAAPDESYVVVSNQNGKLLQRIRTDYRRNRFTLDAAATLDLATGTTPSGAPRQDPALRPDNAPICPLIESTSRFSFVTLRGGGLFVVDNRSTPMRIVAEYDKEAIHGNGCGGLETGGRMYVNSGGGTATNMSEFDVYSFPLWKFSKRPSPPNTPARKLVLSQDEREHTDTHGATLARRGRYLWVADRMGNRIVVIDTRTDRLASEIALPGPLSTDPSPDLMDTSPKGDRVYVSLRGSIPLSGDPHASTGNTPGLCVLKVKDGGRTGEIESIARIANVDPAGIDRADPHALRVRRLSARWGG